MGQWLAEFRHEGIAAFSYDLTSLRAAQQSPHNRNQLKSQTKWRVKSNENVTEGRWFLSKVIVTGLSTPDGCREARRRDRMIPQFESGIIRYSYVA